MVDLGFLSAEESIDVENHAEFGWEKFWWGKQATYKKAFIIERTANISEFGKQMRVLINFQGKVLDNKGGMVEVKQIEDEKYYHDFFSKVDKRIFIQKEKL